MESTTANIQNNSKWRRNTSIWRRLRGSKECSTCGSTKSKTLWWLVGFQLLLHSSSTEWRMEGTQWGSHRQRKISLNYSRSYLSLSKSLRLSITLKVKLGILGSDTPQLWSKSDRLTYSSTLSSQTDAPLPSGLVQSDIVNLPAK